MKNEITKEKLEKYFDLTSRGLKKVRENIIKGKGKEAGEIVEMVSNYLSDARHFEKKKDWVDAFAALNYAHGWLDCGVRTGVFDVSDRDLFTVR
ncbi:DUF357 domain-containing protein [archaeon]|nr:DUF357 domain-containing protein [archaeon]